MIDNPITDFRNKNSNKSNQFIDEMKELIKENKYEDKIEFDYGGFTYSLENQNNEMIFKISDGNETAVLPGKYFKAFANQFDSDFRSLVKSQVQDYVEKSNESIDRYEVIDESIKMVKRAEEIEECIPRKEVDEKNKEQNEISKAKEMMPQTASLESIQYALLQTIGKDSSLTINENTIIYTNCDGGMTLTLGDDAYEITQSNNISNSLGLFILNTINNNINSIQKIDDKISEYTKDNQCQSIEENDILR